jgi:hypothetical protein
MIYETRCPTPKKTAALNPVVTFLPVHPGHIQQVSVEFPLGCCGLVGVAIDYWSHQVWPANPGAWFTGDGAPLAWGEDLDMNDEPYEFKIRTYNLDDTFAHSPVVRIQISPFGTTLKDVLESMAIGPSGPVTAYEE